MTKKSIKFLKKGKKRRNTEQAGQIGTTQSFHDFNEYNWAQFLSSLFQVSETTTSLGNLKISDIGTFVVGVHV